MTWRTLTQRIGALTGRARPGSDPNPPPRAVRAETAPGTIVLHWEPPAQGRPTAYRYGRAGTDATGHGPWSAKVSAQTRTGKLERLTPGVRYRVAVAAVYGTREVRVELNVVVPAQEAPVETDLITWSSGVHTTGHSIEEAEAFAQMRGRPVGHFAAFPTRNAGPFGLADMWWLPPRDVGEIISVGVPMAYDDGSLADDLSEPLRQMARSLAADGRVCALRLGWEFNLAGWPWFLSEETLPQWRSRFAQYASIFREELGEKALVGLNANIGGTQTGMKPDWAERVWMPGQMDWVGIDAYDCFEPYTKDEWIASHWNGRHGLKWWSDFALERKVPLALPEWGVANGTQWAGHRGGDNPRYITEMHKFLRQHIDRGGEVLLDSYFHDREPYLRSDFETNPKAGAEYVRLWGLKPRT